MTQVSCAVCDVLVATQDAEIVLDEMGDEVLVCWRCYKEHYDDPDEPMYVLPCEHLDCDCGCLPEGEE